MRGSGWLTAEVTTPAAWSLNVRYLVSLGLGDGASFIALRVGSIAGGYDAPEGLNGCVGMYVR